MKSSSLTFRANAEQALLDTQLQRALAGLRTEVLHG